MEVTGTIPTGTDILKLLVNLLAEQEGVVIDYEIVRGEKVLFAGNTKKN